MLTLFMTAAMAAIVHPVEIDAPLKNPHKGWVFIDHAVPGQMDAGASIAEVKDGTPYEWYENVAVLSTWALVEPEPDRFDWTMMDACVDFWASKGKRIHLRFSTEDFGSIPGCPRWIFDHGVPATDRNHQRFPDYTHPYYQQRLKKFLAEFANHFAEDSRIETVNLQGYGDFGEWHSGANHATVEDRVAALRGIVDQWCAAFAGRKTLNLSCSYEWMTQNNVGMDIFPAGTSIYELYPPSYYDYRHRSGFDYAYDLEAVTLSRHGVGGAVKQEYDGRLMANFFQHWRKPMFMECFGGIDHYTGPSVVGFRDTKEGDDFVGNAMDELLSHHPTYATPMGWGAGGAAGGVKGSATAFYNDYHDLMLRTLNLMGYRFVLVEARYPDTVAPGGALTIQHTWENRAMGRCTTQYPLAVYLMKRDQVVWQGFDRTFDQTAFKAGETYACTSKFFLPPDLLEGEYDLRVAMADVVDAPALRLAIAGEDSELRYAIGKITVGPHSQDPVPQSEIRNLQSAIEAPENSVNEVSFDYDITLNPANDLDTSAPGYFSFYVTDAEGRRTDEIRWYDKAWQGLGRKTAVVRTANRPPYQMHWTPVGGGAITISNVHVDTIAPDRVRIVNLNSDDVILRNARVEEQVRVRAERDRSAVVLPDDWFAYLQTNPDRVVLKPNTTYTVWFYATARPQIWQGDYHYCRVQGVDLPPWRWTQRHTTGPERHAYTFTTGPAQGAFIEWGMHNGGEATISDITIIER